jgi:heat shock protein HtpX
MLFPKPEPPRLTYIKEDAAPVSKVMRQAAKLRAGKGRIMGKLRREAVDPRHASAPGWPAAVRTASARRRRRSRRHAAMLLAAMAALLGYCGWLVAGWGGVLLSLAGGVLTLLIVRQIPPGIVLRALGARPLARGEAPLLYAILDRLCRAARLSRMPALFVTEAGMPVAFTIGAGGDAAIVLSQGLLAEMTAREIRGILAHEIVHVRNGDIALMQLAMVAGQLARMLAQLALLLLLFGLVLRAAAVPSYPLAPLPLLVVAPLGISLLRLALSREREGEADLEAAELTGDPAGLAAALISMHRREQRLLAARFPGVRLIRMPALLRDHPATEERIRRLLAMPQAGAEAGGDRPRAPWDQPGSDEELDP